MHVALVRHGRPERREVGPLQAGGYARWRADYDAAGLEAGDTPPPALRELGSRAGLVVSSDLPRAVASAQWMAAGAPVTTSSLLREPVPPAPALGTLRLPLLAWRALSAAAWRLDLLPSPERHGAATSRAAEAARWLTDLAAEKGNVVAVTHSGFRRLLSRELQALGWSLGGRPHRGYWSAWILTREDAR